MRQKEETDVSQRKQWRRSQKRMLSPEQLSIRAHRLTTGLEVGIIVMCPWASGLPRTFTAWCISLKLLRHMSPRESSEAHSPWVAVRSPCHGHQGGHMRPLLTVRHRCSSRREPGISVVGVDPASVLDVSNRGDLEAWEEGADRCTEAKRAQPYHKRNRGTLCRRRTGAGNEDVDNLSALRASPFD